MSYNARAVLLGFVIGWTTEVALSDPAPFETGPASSAAASDPATIGNFATRLQVGIGDKALITGFIVQGSGPKKILIRVAGPSLLRLGIGKALQNPRLEVHDSSRIIATNDNWRTTQIGGLVSSEQAAEIQNSGLVPLNDAEPAVIVTVVPGSYTAVVQGVNGETGVGVAEVYDLGQTGGSLLTNMSTRGLVQTQDDVMIAGF